MSGIRRRDTKIEVAVRKALFAKGFRYRVDVGTLPGRPDIVLPKFRSVVLVHGCFWHLHGCALTKIPSTRPEFWSDKLRRNAERDAESLARLRAAGWRVATIWECALRGRGSNGLAVVVSSLENFLRSDNVLLELTA